MTTAVCTVLECPARLVGRSVDVQCPGPTAAMATCSHIRSEMQPASQPYLEAVSPLPGTGETSTDSGDCLGEDEVGSRWQQDFAEDCCTGNTACYRTLTVSRR